MKGFIFYPEIKRTKPWQFKLPIHFLLIITVLATGCEEEEKLSIGSAEISINGQKLPISDSFIVITEADSLKNIQIHY